MKKIIIILLLPFLGFAQSVIITPGAQGINTDSTRTNQLDVQGNGFTLQPKYTYTATEPSANIYTMNCASTSYVERQAGTLYDPSGPGNNYTSGIPYDCSFRLFANTYFYTIEINFSEFNTESNGDSLIISSLTYPYEVYGSYSGATLPGTLLITCHDQPINIRFKTDADGNVGTGFTLTWKAILRSPAQSLNGFYGRGLAYDLNKNKFMVGYHTINQWNSAGSYSIATGDGTVASGNASSAMGYSSEASGYTSMAMGWYSKAIGHYSTALGYSSEASGSTSMAMGRDTEARGAYSTAMGRQTRADTTYATAMGYSTTASGYSSTSMGENTSASGDYSTAMGSETEASGDYSTAMGRSTDASGNYSTAMGRSTRADTSYATAMGRSTTASGYTSTSMGEGTEASGDNSTAMGHDTEAIGDYSTAMGNNTRANGNNSTAMGTSTEASGISSTAIGLRSKANGDYSIAIGTGVTTNNQYGSFVIGDYITASEAADGDSLSADQPSRFLARFENGYKLYTDKSLRSATKYGVFMNNKANSWSSISDSTKKERFLPYKPEEVLNSVAAMRIGTWNYKGDNRANGRHWGVMAQDFYHHFGKDEYGTVGCDTLIATADFDGVAFAAIKALEERTRELQEENTKLQKENEQFRKEFTAKDEQYIQLFSALEDRIKAIENSSRTGSKLTLKAEE